MFRNDNDFDEVSAYRKEQERNNQNDRFSQDNRFDRRDDFKYDEDFGKEESTFSEDDYQPIPKVPKQTPFSRIKSLIVTIITIILISSIFGNMVRGCSSIFFAEDLPKEVATNEMVEPEVVEGNFPLMESKTMNTSEFLKEYEKAKKNQIKFDRLTRNYLSGDYTKSFSIIEKYLTSEYSEDNETRFLCVSEIDEETYKYKPLNCIRDVNKFEDLKYPSDFVEAVSKESIQLYDYLIYNSDSNIAYVINGRVYTQELIDLIIQWHNNGFKY